MVYTDLCSFYFSVFDEHAVDMTLKEFVELLRGERWKAQVEEYQRLKASGRETEAKKLKRKLAALVIAGRCEGSHAETNLKQWSGDAMLDVDKCNGRVSEFLQVLKDTPWVKAAWRSVSYDGLKLVVRVEAESVDEYRLAYALVAWHVAQLLAFPCDMSCKIPPVLALRRMIRKLFSSGYRSFSLAPLCDGASRQGGGDFGRVESEDPGKCIQASRCGFGHAAHILQRVPGAESLCGWQKNEFC